MSKNLDAQEAALLAEMRESGLPVQKGGYEVMPIPTGLVRLDASTGIGGLPAGRMTLIFGEEGSGKTLILLHTIAAVQAAGGKAAFVDLEHALTPGFARLMNVDYDSLVVSRPKTLNEAYDVAKSLLKSGIYTVVGFDSAVALTTIENAERSAMEGAQRAAEAGVHSEELKKVMSMINDDAVFVVINQLRTNPNPPSWWSAGPMYYMPGGRALRFHSSMTIKVRKTKQYKDGSGNKVGNRIATVIEKNKVGVPFKRAEFDLKYESGIDLIEQAIEIGLEDNLIVQNGSWFEMVLLSSDGEVVEEKKWHGRAKMDAEFRENDALVDYIRSMAAHDGGPRDVILDAGWDNVPD